MPSKGSSSEDVARSATSLAGELCTSGILASISRSILLESPKTVSKNASFRNGFRSGYSWPTPKYSMGLDVILTIESAAPPLASASLLVKMEQSKSVYS